MRLAADKLDEGANAAQRAMDIQVPWLFGKKSAQAEVRAAFAEATDAGHEVHDMLAVLSHWRPAAEGYWKGAWLSGAAWDGVLDGQHNRVAASVADARAATTYLRRAADEVELLRADPSLTRDHVMREAMELIGRPFSKTTNVQRERLHMLMALPPEQLPPTMVYTKNTRSLAMGTKDYQQPALLYDHLAAVDRLHNEIVRLNPNNADIQRLGAARHEAMSEVYQQMDPERFLEWMPETYMRTHEAVTQVTQEMYHKQYPSLAAQELGHERLAKAWIAGTNPDPDLIAYLAAQTNNPLGNMISAAVKAERLRHGDSAKTAYKGVLDSLANLPSSGNNPAIQRLRSETEALLTKNRRHGLMWGDYADAGKIQTNLRMIATLYMQEIGSATQVRTMDIAVNAAKDAANTMPSLQPLVW